MALGVIIPGKEYTIPNRPFHRFQAFRQILYCLGTLCTDFEAQKFWEGSLGYFILFSSEKYPG